MERHKTRRKVSYNLAALPDGFSSCWIGCRQSLGGDLRRRFSR